jgi:hypothetical protein
LQLRLLRRSLDLFEERVPVPKDSSPRINRPKVNHPKIDRRTINHRQKRLRTLPRYTLQTPAVAGVGAAAGAAVAAVASRRLLKPLHPPL